MGQNLFGAQPSVNGAFKRNMGLGALGLATTSIKRKFRWTLTISPKCPQGNYANTGLGVGYIGPNFCKVASRPNYDIEETELNFLNAKTWIAGKLTWQSITATFIDASAAEIQNLYLWIGQNARLDDNIKFWQGTQFQDYAASAELILYTGCGQPMEAWLLDNVWPQAVNFGELDYTSSEEATIELTLRYDSVKYFGFCPQISFSSCCSPCQPVQSGVAQAVGQ
jgi:hypothetical protein